MSSKRNRIILIIVSIVVLIIAGIVVAGAVFLFGCNSNRKAEGNLQEVHTGMYVDGTTLCTADGEPFVMRGVNHAHCWYKDFDDVALDSIAKTGANSVRLVCANGKRWDTDTKEELSGIIEASKNRNMVAIVECHDGTGSDDIGLLQSITDYWCEMADVLKGTEEYCILNIANEWVGGTDCELWRDGYIEAIQRLRAAGIHNVIMVDGAGWAQYGRSIRKNGLEVFEADPDRNTMFSVHMYGDSGRFEWLIRYNLKGATDQNLCVCVGEFGYKHTDGDVKEDYLMKYCAENNIGTLAWSWKGNSGGVEYLDLSNDWEGNDLSLEWGDKVINGEYGIKNTAVLSSYFRNK